MICVKCLKNFLRLKTVICFSSRRLVNRCINRCMIIEETEVLAKSILNKRVYKSAPLILNNIGALNLTKEMFGSSHTYILQDFISQKPVKEFDILGKTTLELLRKEKLWFEEDLAETMLSMIENDTGNSVEELSIITSLPSFIKISMFGYHLIEMVIGKKGLFKVPRLELFVMANPNHLRDLGRSRYLQLRKFQMVFKCSIFEKFPPNAFKPTFKKTRKDLSSAVVQSYVFHLVKDLSRISRYEKYHAETMDLMDALNENSHKCALLGNAIEVFFPGRKKTLEAAGFKVSNPLRDTKTSEYYKLLKEIKTWPEFEHSYMKIKYMDDSPEPECFTGRPTLKR